MERQIRQMGSMIKVPSDMPSLEDEIDQRILKVLQERIQNFFSKE